MASLILPKNKKEIEKESALQEPILDEDQVKELFEARCKDLKIPVKKKQLLKFSDTCMEKCLNRKMNLEKMFLGPVTATLLANWLMLGLIEVSHLLLGQNNFGDVGI